MPKNPFLKYVMKDKKEDVFHSSAYAKAQNGASIGAASSESYAVRVKINSNRKMVGNYGSSRIASGAINRAPKAAAGTAGAGAASVGNTRTAGAGVVGRAAASAPKTPGVSVKK